LLPELLRLLYLLAGTIGFCAGTIGVRLAACRLRGLEPWRHPLEPVRQPLAGQTFSASDLARSATLQHSVICVDFFGIAERVRADKIHRDD
jgi:hypothetical protein